MVAMAAMAWWPCDKTITDGCQLSIWWPIYLLSIVDIVVRLQNDHIVLGSQMFPPSESAFSHVGRCHKTLRTTSGLVCVARPKRWSMAWKSRSGLLRDGLATVREWTTMVWDSWQVTRFWLLGQGSICESGADSYKSWLAWGGSLRCDLCAMLTMCCWMQKATISSNSGHFILAAGSQPLQVLNFAANYMSLNSMNIT